eukprot:3478865-Amphidinium_carterae.3
MRCELEALECSTLCILFCEGREYFDADAQRVMETESLPSKQRDCKIIRYALSCNVTVCALHP